MALERIMSAASSSMVPPEFTDHDGGVGFPGRVRGRQALPRNAWPGTGSPPTPTRVETPKPARTTIAVTSLVRLPERVMTPIRPGL